LSRLLVFDCVVDIVVVWYDENDNTDTADDSIKAIAAKSKNLILVGGDDVEE
jgi:hypothetical protein